MRVLFLTVLAAAMGCDLGPDTTVELGVYPREFRVWRDERIPVNTSLDDQAGMQGIKVELGGAIGQSVTFTAADFTELVGAERRTRAIGVPDGGWLTIKTELTQDGAVVAEGAGRWLLESDVASWIVDITRGPYPAVEPTQGRSLEDTSCDLGCWCHTVFRLPIREHARNHETEALWVTVSMIPEICTQEGVICC